MNIYRITQNTNNGYDTYSYAIVVAPDAETAVKIYPGRESHATFWDDLDPDEREYSGWASPENVTAEFITRAPDLTACDILCASFHAG